VRFRHHAESLRLDCDFIAGCDGFHGVSRRAIPAAALHSSRRWYPFGGWRAGADAAIADITYANHPRGFRTRIARNPRLSRYYIQVPLDTKIEDWPDERFWSELKARFSGRARAGRSSPTGAREVDRSAAQLRRRTDAARKLFLPATPRTSCRPPARKD